MNDTDTATFTLSQEEVYFVLSQVRAKGLLGIDPAPLAAFTADQRLAVLAAAGRALLARGFIIEGEDGAPLLDKAVRATVHAAAFARASLTVITRGPGERVLHTYVYHHAEPLWVRHTQPDAGLHTFTLSAQSPPIQSDLETLLGLAQQSAPLADPILIDQQELEQIQQHAAVGDSDSIRTVLTARGSSESSAQAFAELLTQPRDSAILQVLDRGKEMEETRTITVLHNPQGFWIMESCHSNQLRCSPVAAGELRTVLAGLVEQLVAR